MAETHEKAFRGCWCPPQLFDLLASGEITKSDFVLLLTVDSLVQSSGKDCFASLAYLGSRLGVREDEVSRSVSKLKTMGLLIQTKFDGRRRHMHAFWSRVQPRNIPQGRVGENPKAGLGKTPTIGDTRELEDILPASEPVAKDLRFIKMARKLATAIQLHTGVGRTNEIYKWVGSFKALHTNDKVDYPRIKTALKWYINQLEAPLSFVPSIDSGFDFRNKFIKLEKAMAREQKEREGKENQQTANGDEDNGGVTITSKYEDEK